MNTLRYKFIIPTVLLGAILFLSIIVFSMNNQILNPFFVLAMSFVAFILLYLTTIAQMVRTGRVKAKGAKKRRRKILPVLYKKKAKSVRYRMPNDSANLLK